MILIKRKEVDQVLDSEIVLFGDEALYMTLVLFKLWVEVPNENRQDLAHEETLLDKEYVIWSAQLER